MKFQDWFNERGYSFKGEKIVNRKRYKWDVDAKDLYAYWVVEADVDFMVYATFEDELFKMHESNMSNESEGNHQIPTVRTKSDLIRQCCELEGITFDTRGSTIYQHGTSIGYADWETIVLKYNDDYTEDSPKDTRRTYGADQIKREMKYYIHNLDREQRGILKTQMDQFDPIDEAYTNKFLSWMIKSFEIEGQIKFNRAMIKHWMWQTKRYVLGLNVQSPIFVNFFGESQETGKTKFIENLTRGFKDYRANISLSDMLDDRRSELWTKNYVAVADELKLGDVSGKQMGQLIAVIKNYLTAETIEYRELGNHRFVKGKRTFSPISSSNKSIVDVIIDDTGMRRFYEFAIKAKPNRKLAHARVQEFIDADMESIWRGINPNLEEGYVTRHNEYGAMLEEIQSTYKHFDYLDLFLSDEDVFFSKMVRASDKVAIDQITKITDREKWTIDEISALGYLPWTTTVFVKEAKKWIGSIDSQAEKFVPSVMTVAGKLVKKGFFLLSHGKKDYVLTKDSEE